MSNEVAQEPVFNRASGHVYERKLVEKYIRENGKDPASGIECTIEDLQEIKSMCMDFMSFVVLYIYIVDSYEHDIRYAILEFDGMHRRRWSTLDSGVAVCSELASPLCIS